MPSNLKNLTKIADKGGYLVKDRDRLLFIEWTVKETKFFAFDNDRGLEGIHEREFSEVIGGKHFEKIQEQLGGVIHDYRATEGLNGDRYFCFYQEGIIHGFDKDGNKKYEWLPSIGRGHAIYDIKFQPPNSLWLAFPTGQTVSKISLDMREEEYRIGDYAYDEVYDPLSYPESLFITDKHLFIPNMGSGKLFRLELATYQLDLIETYEDRLWEYIQIGKYEYVHLNNGIFRKERMTAANQG